MLLIAFNFYFDIVGVAMSCLAAGHVSMSGTVGMEDLIKVAPL